MNPGPDTNRASLMTELYAKFHGTDGRASRSFTCQRDGSVPNGIEIISRPLTFQASLEFLDDLLPLQNGTDEYQRLRACGMHVHISRSALSQNQLGRMVLFVHSPPMFDFMSRVARRQLTNHFCRAGQKRSWLQGFTELTPHQRQAVKTRITGLDYRGRIQNHGKYQALNTERRDTIEVRMFASTNDPLYAKSNIEFCEAMLTYCKPMVSPLKDLVIPHKFIDFVTSNRMAYPSLSERFGYRDRFGEFYEFPVTASGRPRRPRTDVSGLPRGQRTMRITPAGLEGHDAEVAAALRFNTERLATEAAMNLDRSIAASMVATSQHPRYRRATVPAARRMPGIVDFGVALGGGSRPHTTEIRAYVAEHGMPVGYRRRREYLEWYRQLCNNRFVTARGNVLTGDELSRRAIERLRCAR